MPSDLPIYELRATRPDGSETTAGLFATHNEATEQAWLLLSSGAARWVETLRRQDGRVELLSIIGEGRRPNADGTDDRLRPRHDEGGLIW